MSVVTQSEGAPGLQKMEEGLMMRYDSAKEPSPYLLYTDWDCCSKHSEILFSISLYNQMIPTHCFESHLAGSFLQVAYIQICMIRNHMCLPSDSPIKQRVGLLGRGTSY